MFTSDGLMTGIRGPGRGDAEAQHTQTDQADCGTAEGRRQGRDLLGSRPGRLRRAGPHDRAQALHRPVPGAGRPEAGDPGTDRHPDGRRAPARGGHRHRPDQARRGPEAARAGARAHRRRPRGALSQESCRGAVQAEHGQELPHGHPAPCSPRLGNEGPEGCRARGRYGAAPQAARYARGGKPSDVGAFQNVHPGRELGDGAARPQAGPACPAIPREVPRAIPDAGGIPVPGSDAEAARGQGLDDAVGDRGDPTPDADRVPL